LADVVLERCPEIGDEPGQGRLGHERPRPEHVPDLRLGEGPRTSLEQQAEQFAGLRLYVYRLSCPKELAALLIVCEIPE
jgi:hypothetical protein